MSLSSAVIALSDEVLRLEEQVTLSEEFRAIEQSIACGWAWDLSRRGVRCFWCDAHLGNDDAFIREHTATCSARQVTAEARIAAAVAAEREACAKVAEDALCSLMGRATESFQLGSVRSRVKGIAADIRARGSR